MISVRWKVQPDDHDYPAAAAYLSLIADDGTVGRLVDEIKKAPIVHAKAKDILRAATLPELPPENVHVAKDLAKVKAGKSLSPVLLVRGGIGRGLPLVIADGYHRVCASHHLDEDTDIPCRIAAFPGEQ